ncbi:unnamed protein product, partial [Tilletia laevis]
MPRTAIGLSAQTSVDLASEGPYAGLSIEEAATLERVRHRIETSRNEASVHRARALSLQEQAAATTARADQSQVAADKVRQELDTWKHHTEQGNLLFDPQIQYVRGLQGRLHGLQANTHQLRDAAQSFAQGAQDAELESVSLEQTAETVALEHGRLLLEAKTARLASIRDLRQQLTASQEEVDAQLRQASPALLSDAAFNAHTSVPSEAPVTPAVTAAQVHAPLVTAAQAHASSARPLVTVHHSRLSAINDTDHTAIGVTLTAGDQVPIKPRRGKVPADAESAITALRQELSEQISQICKDHGVHPADVRALLGFGEQVVRESNNFNRFQNWFSGSGGKSGAKGHGSFMTEVKAAWDDLKTDGERMRTTMEAVKKWELDSRRANKIESVREALAEHERRALKLTVQAEESKGICSIVIVTHPHPEVNGFIVATSHTERVAKRCVTRSRNLAELVSYFDSYVRWNPPRSMRLPDEHREADDGDDSDEVQIRKRRKRRATRDQKKEAKKAMPTRTPRTQTVASGDGNGSGVRAVR